MVDALGGVLAAVDDDGDDDELPGGGSRDARSPAAEVITSLSQALQVRPGRRLHGHGVICKGVHITIGNG